MEIRDYSEQPIDIEIIKKTWEASFNKKFNKDYWEWRFKNKPNFSRTFIKYIMDGSTLVGYYAVTPEEISINGEKKLIAYSNMTMTHPDYQGNGFFKKLATSMYDTLKAEGFIGVFGFANGNSHYGFRKYLGWKDLAVLSNFTLTADHDIYPKLIDDTLMVSFKDEIEFSQFTLDAEALNKIHVPRRPEHLKWRLTDMPVNSYQYCLLEGEEVKSCVIYKIFENEVDILEILSHKDQSPAGVTHLGTGIAAIKKRHQGDVNIWSNLHSEEHLYLEKLGFRYKNFTTFFGVIPFVDDKALTSLESWHYRFYDSDVY